MFTRHASASSIRYDTSVIFLPVAIIVSLTCDHQICNLARWATRSFNNRSRIHAPFARHCYHQICNLARWADWSSTNFLASTRPWPDIVIISFVTCWRAFFRRLYDYCCLVIAHHIRRVLCLYVDGWFCAHLRALVSVTTCGGKKKNEYGIRDARRSR